MSVTVNDLHKATKVKPRTLIRWHKMGLIPPPHIGPGPGGKGRVGYWDDAVLQIVKGLVKRKTKKLPTVFREERRAVAVAKNEVDWDEVPF